MNFASLDYQQGHRPNDIFINCPFCKDYRYKMGVNLTTLKYNCFICEARPFTHGPIKNIEQLAFLVPHHDHTLDDIKGRLKNLGKKLTPSIDLDEISWHMHPKDTPIGYQYMLNRGFTDSEIDQYQLRVGKDYYDKEKEYRVQKWAGRIIFPFFDNGRTTYCVGRAYTGKEPKYLNSRGKKEFLVWGLDTVDNGVAILCEGVISAISAQRTTGIPAICVLGKSISGWQLAKIQQKCHTVYKSFDGGIKTEEDEKTKKLLTGSGLTVYNIQLPGTSDPDDLGEEYLKYFQTAEKLSFIY